MDLPSSCILNKMGNFLNYYFYFYLYLSKILSKYDGTAAGEDDMENSSVYPSTGRTVREENVPMHFHKVK